MIRRLLRTAAAALEAGIAEWTGRRDWWAEMNTLRTRDPMAFDCFASQVPRQDVKCFGCNTPIGEGETVKIGVDPVWGRATMTCRNCPKPEASP
jgi:hypothetical protein